MLVCVFLPTPDAAGFSYPNNPVDRPITLPEGMAELGVDVNIDLLVPPSSSSSQNATTTQQRQVFLFRFGLHDDLELLLLGLKYARTVDRIGDHEVAIRARMLNSGENVKGDVIWNSDAAIEGKLKLNDWLAFAYQAENYHTFNPAINDRDVIGGTMSAVVNVFKHLSFSGGGSYQSLTNYSAQSAGYFNLQILVNTKKVDFALEGVWANGLGYVNMSDMTTPAGTQTYGAMLYLRF
ncbi:MAG: hypothetical protein HY280_09465 [Nitrospinae bacterium]|nr:hypothetical protein [Nitrospinota bacterium]